LAGLALLAVGFAFGYRELAALGCACLGALAGAVGFVAWRPHLDVARDVAPDRVMRGESSTVHLEISNASRLFGVSLMARDRTRTSGGERRVTGSGGERRVTAGGGERRVTAGGGERRVIASGGERRVTVPLVRLRPGRVTTTSHAVPTRRRGVVEVGPLEITRRDPLGLVGVVRRYGDSARVWVRPRAHPIAAVPVGLSRSMDGRVDRVPHGSITFATLRNYVVGDDLRHVHWRTSARVGELMVREHVDTSLPRVVVLVDDRSSAHVRDGRGESTFEAACEAAASVVVAAVREGVHVEVQLVRSGTASATDNDPGLLLDLLAEATLADAEPDELGVAMERLRLRRRGDTLLYLTGPPDNEDLALVAGLRGAYPSVIAGVFGPVENGLTASSGILVLGAGDGADFAAAWDGVRAW
jgi:uncharacterized protein (DUF58 family)